MAQPDRDRLIGWKAIGAFVGRDERTVRRWEAERGLPVHRVPGGGSATVWALPRDLSNWLARDAPEPASPSTPVAARRPWLAWAAGVAAMATAAIAIPFVTAVRATNPPPAATAPYGDDRRANDLYRTATYAMATRSVAGLSDAARTFSALAAAYPTRPAAYVGIAETNLLLREFNSIPDDIAYRRADYAARRALALDPRSAGGLRALAFVRFWGEGAREEGLALFRCAVEAAPGDAQTRHWYGTALLGDGRPRASIEVLDQAHALNPGSSAISADIADARYVAGERRAALAGLREITVIDPAFSGAYTYLARFSLIEGDDRAFLDAATTGARLRHDADRLLTLQAAAAAQRTGGHRAMLASLIAAAKDKFEPRGEKAITIALLYAVAGDRDDALAWVGRADSLGEAEIHQLRGFAEFVPYRHDPAFGRYFAVR